MTKVVKDGLFIASYQEYSVYLALEIKKQYQLDPVFFMTNKLSKALVENMFPSAITQNYFDSCKGKNLTFIPQTFFDLNLNQIKYLNNHMNTALHMIERNDSHSHNFSFKEREYFIYKQARYWKNVLLNLKVRMILFEEEPHQVSDYVIYLVAKTLNIKTLMGISTISNLGIFYTYDYREAPVLKYRLKQLKNSDAKFDFKKLNPSILNYIKKIKGDYQAVLEDHLWDQVDRIKAKKLKGIKKLKSNIFIFFKNFSKRLLKTQIYISYFLGDFETDQKETSRELVKSNQKYPEYLLQKFKTIRTKRKLEKFYKKIAVSYSKISDRKFVLLALQYQPEKSTCPLASIFVNQKLIVESLLEALPDDIILLVREHPSQFVEDYTRYGECYRNQSYYKELLENKRVKLSKLEDDVFKLIDNCEFVASAGGNILWEAFLRGKVALSFADAWFNEAEGIYNALYIQDLNDLVKKILNKPIIDENLIFKFLYSLDKTTVKAAIGGPLQLKRFKLEPRENAVLHMKAINELIQLK